jgi:hypothetical protein
MVGKTSGAKCSEELSIWHFAAKIWISAADVTWGVGTGGTRGEGRGAQEPAEKQASKSEIGILRNTSHN